MRKKAKAENTDRQNMQQRHKEQSYLHGADVVDDDKVLWDVRVGDEKATEQNVQDNGA